jgi:hypothetical protein
MVVVTSNPVPPMNYLGIPNTKLQPQYAADGNINTRYSTGAFQAGTEWIEINLGKALEVEGLELNDTIDTADVAVAFNVQVSTNGTMWTTVFTSPGPATTDQFVSFTPTKVQYVRVNQTGVSAVSWWSVDELVIRCTADGGP